MRLEHRAQVLDATQPVSQLRGADLADQRRRIGSLVAIHLVLGGTLALNTLERDAHIWVEDRQLIVTDEKGLREAAD